MRPRTIQILAALFVAVLGGGSVALLHRLGLLWVGAVLGTAALAGALGFVLPQLFHMRRHLRQTEALVDQTRQNVALLARYTRELRESALQTARCEQFRSDDLAALSALVHDLAHDAAEMDRRLEETLAQLPQSYSLAQGHAPRAEPVARDFVPKVTVPLREETPSASSPLASPIAPQRVVPLAPPAPSVFVSQGIISTSTPPIEPAAIRGIERVPLPGLTRLGSSEPSRQIRQLVSSAIAADRFDLYLQRVIGLPQRKIRAYHLTLRPEGSDLSIDNTHLRMAIESVGHQLAFDRRLMLQAIRLARSFVQTRREGQIIIDLSQRFLVSEAAMADVRGLLADQPDLAQRIVLAMPLRFFSRSVSYDHEALGALHRLGFQFMASEVEEFAFDPIRLARIGVRWLRMESARLLDLVSANDTLLGVAAADIVEMLERNHLHLIAENIEDEATIAELLDYDIGFAQGSAIAPPQPVRSDTFEALATKAAGNSAALGSYGGHAVQNQAPQTGMGTVGAGPLPPEEKRSGLRELARRA